MVVPVSRRPLQTSGRAGEACLGKLEPQLPFSLSPSHYQAQGSSLGVLEGGDDDTG